MTLRATAKRLILGTALESPTKLLLYGLTRAKNNLYDVRTIEIMRRVLTRASVAVDIGAFEGSMLRHMIRFAPDARHFAFEPLPDRYVQLKRRFPGVNVLPYALSDAPGEQPYFEVVAYPAMSGLRHRAGLGALDVREQTVPVETLDRTIPGDVAVSFVKVDVEGGELAVFRGGLETLRRCRPVIVFECGLGVSTPTARVPMISIPCSIGTSVCASTCSRPGSRAPRASPKKNSSASSTRGSTSTSWPPLRSGLQGGRRGHALQ